MPEQAAQLNAPVGTTVQRSVVPVPASDPTTGFRTELHSTVISEPKSLFGRSRWKLIDDLVYQAARIPGWTITVPAGFETDFASVPRLPITYSFVGDTAHEASTVHDALYRRQPMSRRMCDAIFYDAALASGNPRWRSYIMWAGIRLFGWLAWRQDRPDKGSSP